MTTSLGWAIKHTSHEEGRTYSGLVGRGWWPRLWPNYRERARRDSQHDWDCRTGTRLYRTREVARRALKLLKASGLCTHYMARHWSTAAVVEVLITIKEVDPLVVKRLEPLIARYLNKADSKHNSDADVDAGGGLL